MNTPTGEIKWKDEVDLIAGIDRERRLVMVSGVYRGMVMFTHSYPFDFIRNAYYEGKKILDSPDIKIVKGNIVKGG